MSTIMKLTYYLPKHTVEQRVKVLGLMDEKTFANLYRRPDVYAKEMFKCKSIKLETLLDEACKGHRLAMITTINSTIMLLITKPLSMMYSCTYDSNGKQVIDMGFTDKEDNMINICYEG